MVLLARAPKLSEVAAKAILHPETQPQPRAPVKIGARGIMGFAGMMATSSGAAAIPRFR